MHERMSLFRPMIAKPLRWFLSGVMIGGVFITSHAMAETPTIPDVKQKMAAREYVDALRLIGSAMTARKPDDDATRYDLLMLRGESQAQLSQRLEAASSFDAAVKSAPNAGAAASARANALLFRAAQSNKYTPKSGGQPIDLLDPESRKQAFAALRDELAAKTDPQLQAALRDNTLAPSVKVLPAMIDLCYLEYAAQGSAEKTRAELKSLGDHARGLMNTELRRLRRQTDAAEDMANSYSNNGRRGLTSPQRIDVQRAIEYVKQIENTAREARRRARDLGFDGAAWEPIIADAADIVEEQQSLLNLEPH